MRRGRGVWGRFAACLILTALCARPSRLCAEPVKDVEALRARGRTAAWDKRYDEAIKLLTRAIEADPTPPAFKELAEVYSWAGRTDDSARWYQTYLDVNPDDEQVRIAMATMFSWSKERRHQDASLRLFGEILGRHPDNRDARLARARLQSWMGLCDPAAVDFRAVLAAKEESSVRLDLARNLSWGNRIDESVREFDRVIQTGTEAERIEARLGRAMALRWAGRIALAERGLDSLRSEIKDPEVLRKIDLERARLYAGSGRRLRGMALLDELTANSKPDSPIGKEIEAERKDQGLFFRPALTPAFNFYLDRGDISAITMGLGARVSVHRRVSLFTDLAAWRLADATQDLWTGRFDLGAKFLIADFLDLELAAGPRIYQSQDTSGGGHAAAVLRPLTWLSAGVRYAFDDVYPDLYAPKSVQSHARGHWIYGEAEVAIPGLPFRLTAGTRVGGRFVTPDNRGLEVSGNLMAQVGPFAVGYAGHFISWDKNDLSYWSPQSYQSHMGVIRLSQNFSRIGLDYELSGSVGPASERVDGVADSGDWGVAFGGAAGLAWHPTHRLALKFNFQMGQTVRNLLQSVASDMGPPQIMSVTSAYWWLSTGLSFNVIL